MLHALFRKRIFSALFLVLILGACSDTSPTKETVHIDGRNIEIPDSNKLEEPALGETSTLVLSFQSPITGTVSYQSFNITAAEKSDYLSVTGVIEVVEGDTYNIPVYIYGDDEIEGNEQFGIRILDELGAEVAVIVAQISNDDLPSLTVTSPVISEGDAGTARLSFELQLSHPVVEPYTVTITSDVCDGWVDNSDDIRYASPCNDFEAIDITLIFEQGVQSSSFDVVVLSDDILEKDEVVQLSVKSAGINALPEGGFALGTIRTDEEPDRNGFELSMAINPGEVLVEDGPQDSQSDWNPVTYTVTVSNSNSFDETDGIKQTQSIEVNLQGLDRDLIDGDGLMEGESFYRAEYLPVALDSDFCVNNPGATDEDGQCLQIATIQLEPGTKTFEFTFYVSADLMSEPDENIEIILQNDQGVFFSRYFHQVIDDDDPELVLVLANGDEISLKEFVAGNQSGEFDYLVVNEEDGTLGIVLKLANELLYPWSFSYTFNRPSNSGSAAEASSSDYARKSGEINFAAGSVIPEDGALTVDITNDGDYEGTELFGLNFVDINVDSLLINIIDDDFPALAMVMPNGDEIEVITGTNYVDAPEPVGASPAASIYSYKMLLNASTADDTSIVARTDLKLFYTIIDAESDGVPTANTESCGYLAAPTEKTDELDYRLYIKKGGVRSQIPAGEAVDFFKGESQINVEIEINKDGLVECDEYLAIEFKLVDGEANIDSPVNHTIKKIFKIENKNKALLSVYGWKVDEGSSLDSISTQIKNFELRLDQAVSTQIPYTIFGDNHECNSEDISGLSTSDIANFNGVETLKNVTVSITQDNIVEPQENCTLSIIDGYDSDLLDVQYCDENEICGVNLNSVQGVIVNDDFLTITLSTAKENQIEPSESHEKLHPFSIKWDKDIAANVGSIDIDPQVVTCLESVSCLSESEFEVSDLIIRTENEIAQVAQTTAKSTPFISVLADNKVELTELFKVDFSIGQGSDYIKALVNPSQEVHVLNQDKLNLAFKKVDSTVPLDGESGYLEYIVSWGDVAVDATVGDLTLDWVVAGDAVRKVDNEQDNHDYSLLINDVESLTNTLVLKSSDVMLAANGSINLKVLLGDDELIEISESMVVNLMLPVSGLYLVNTWDMSGQGALDGVAQHTIVNDDFLTISINSIAQGTEGDKDEQGDPISLSEFSPFTYAWDKNISANVPNIEIAVTSNCTDLASEGGPNSQNCAELNDYNFGDNVTGNLISIHKQGQNDTPAVPEGRALLTVVPDNRIEGNEDLVLKISSAGLDSIKTNIEGQAYLKDVLVTGNGSKSEELITINSTIINDDTLALTITKSSSDSCYGFKDESGCQQFILGWTKDIDSDVGVINLKIDRTGSTAKMASESEFIAGIETLVEPQDYKITLDQEELSGDVLMLKEEFEELSQIKSKLIQVHILEDDFVEPLEIVKVKLVPESTFINVEELNDDNTGWFTGAPFEYSVPLDDRLTLVFSKAANENEPNVDLKPYSINWSKPVAKSTANIAIEISAQGCVATNSVKCATPMNDFILDTLLSLHSFNTFTPITTELDFGVTVKPDDIVEFIEQVQLVVSAASGSDDYLNNIVQPAPYLIGNDDTAKVSLEAVSSPIACASESCSPEFDIKWDKGFAKELPRLSLDLTMVGTGVEASDYTFSLASCDFSIDNPSACETSLTNFELMPANRQLDTVAGDTKRVAIHIKDDDLVEVDETLTLILDKLGNNQIDYTVKGGLFSANHTIINDDFLTLTITSTNLGAEGDVNEQGESLSANNFEPFSYAWDKDIDKNVPAIQFAVLQNCADSSEVNCAEEADFTFSNNLSNHLITIHGGGNTTLAQPDGITLITVEPDNRVEADEELHIQVSAENLDAIETNLAGRAYIEGLKLNDENIVANGLVNTSSKIINDDKVQLSFSKTSEDANISNYGEGGFLSYQIDWQDVEVDLDVLLSLQLNIPTDAKAIRKTNDSVFDYTLKVASDTGDVVTGDQWLLKQQGSSWDASGSSTLYVQLNNDNLVEKPEDIEIQLSLPAGSHELAIQDADSSDTLLGTVAYTIPVADKVQLNIVKDGTNLATASENSATNNIYTVEWDKMIADDVPELSFNLEVEANTDTESEDFSVSIPLGFNSGENTLSKTAGSFSFSTTVVDDSIVELEESFTTTLSIPDSNPNNADYLELVNTQDTPNSFTHTITDTDKVTLNLAVDNPSSDENEEAIAYTVNWVGSAEANIAPLTFNLDISGEVTFDESNTEKNDYSVTSKPFTQTNSDAYVLKPANSALAADSSATLTLQVKQDSILEVDEALTVSLSSPVPSTLLEVGNATATHTILNDDFLTLTINGAASQPEPTGQVNINAYSLSWDKTIELPDSKIPSVSLLKNGCTGTSTLECLDTNDYTLSAASLALTTSGQSKTIALPLSLKPDDQVELQEKIALQFNVPSAVVEKIVFSESGETVIRDANSQADLQMEWDLTVLSEDRLELAMGTAVENITECNSASATCLPAQTINILNVTGEVAQNGPTITLQTIDDCTDTDVSAGLTCAQSLDNENGGIDYTLQADNAEFVLHTYNQPSNSDIKTKHIKISPNQDNWVEIEETVKLKISPDAASVNYVTQNWEHKQSISLTSEDIVAVSLARDSTPATNDNGLCEFESGSSTDIVEASCNSQFDVILTKSIASEVANISVALTASGDSQLKIKAADGETAAQTKFDVIAQYGLADIYPEGNSNPAVFSLPVHSNGAVTKPADAKVFKLIYQEDKRIETDESIRLALSEGAGSQYTVPLLNNDEFTVNETLKNNDFLTLTVSGSNTHDEPDTSVTPYILSWNGEVEEGLTVSISDSQACVATAIQKCLSKGLGEDYTLNTLTIPLVGINEGDQHLTLDLTLLQKDSLVEFPEIVNLQLVVDSPLVSGVVHDNGDASDTGNYITSTKVGDESTLDWTLTVNSEDKLTLNVTDEVASVTEACPSKDDGQNCMQVATVSKIKVTGAIAGNGPALHLTTSDVCTTANTATNSDNCAILEGKKGGPDNSEKDYKINAATANIALNGLENGAEIPINLTVNDDAWIEIPEFIKLSITPNEASKVYINQGNTWAESQTIELNSDDKTEITLDFATTNCGFESGTTSFIEKECNSNYAFTLNKFIAKEVPTITVDLSKDANTNAEIKPETDDGNPFDISLTLDGAEQYFTGNVLELPIHTIASATSVFSKEFKLTYNNDVRVEIPESIKLSLGNITPTTDNLFSTPNEALVIDETILNDDILKLGVTISSATGLENAITAEYDYSYKWNYAVDADVGDLTFQLDFDESDANAATQGGDDDYVVEFSGSQSQRFSLAGNLLTLSMSSDLPAGGHEDYLLKVKDDDLVEVDETITATLSLVPNGSVDATDATQAANLVAIIDADNGEINHTIENDDKLTVTLYAIESFDEGTDLAAQGIQPFSYAIDKNIAANVPTIELYMDATSCINSDTINCAEYTYQSPVLESNDFSFGSVDLTQIVTLHEGPVINDEGAITQEGAYTEKSQIDQGTGNVITTNTPLISTMDERVEAHESLVIKFDRDGGLTNEPGRAYIEDVVDGNAVAVSPASDVTLTAKINNDDKIKLVMSDADNVESYGNAPDCTTIGPEEAYCEYVISLAQDNGKSVTDGTQIPIDDDAGEISLSITHSVGDGYSLNDAIYEDESAVPLVVVDPQDYKIEISNSVAEQTNRLILKSKGTPISDFPRTIRVSSINDSFIENNEQIAFEIKSDSNDEYVDFFHDHVNDEHKNNEDKISFSYNDITSDDSLTVTLIAPQAGNVDVVSGIEGNSVDSNNNTLTYAVELSNPVVPGYGSITLSLSDGTIPNGSTGALENTDFTVDSSLPIHETGSATYGDALNKQVTLTVIKDDMLELDELIEKVPSLTGGPANLAGLSAISYTIENDDTLNVTFTENVKTVLEGNSNSDISYSFTTDTDVAANYPQLMLGFAANSAGRTAQLNTEVNDYSAAASIELHAGTMKTAAINGGSYAITVNGDTLVEPTETLTLDASSNAPESADVVFKKGGDVISNLTLEITNDDFIEVDFQCDGSSCDGNLAETGGSNSVEVVVVNGYDSDDLTTSERTATFVVAGLEESAMEGVGKDYLLASVPLPESASANDHINSIITVNNDAAIEKTETLTIASALSSFITTSFSRTEFTIKSDDYLTVNPLASEVSDSDAAQAYLVELCRPTNDLIQGGGLELITRLQKVKNNANEVINTVEPLTCDDIQLPNVSDCSALDDGSIAEIKTILSAIDVGNIPACTGTPSSTYSDITLFTLKAQATAIEANEWFTAEVEADERCNTVTAIGTCADPVNVVVFNNQLSNVLDTGLTQCLQSGLDKRWAVDCGAVDTYKKQDASQTAPSSTNNIYPDLTYTYVNGDGEPAATRPESGEVCVQDNNTGFIWSGTILNGGVNIRVFDVLTDIGERTNYDCGLSGDATWQLPTVQDLMTIMDVEKLKATRDFGIRFTDNEGKNVDNVEFYVEFGFHTASYWTSKVCDIDKYYTVNFLNGEVECSAKTVEHSIMMLYK